MKIEVYDPAMCCPTGVCGPRVDPELVRFQEALRQIQKQAPAVEVKRYSLSNDPQAYVANACVAELLKDNGPQILPLVFVNGTLLCKGSYPANEQLQLNLKNNGFGVELDVRKKSGCGCRPGCC